MMIWFLVSMATGSYIGPMDEHACAMAGTYLQGQGIVCKQADRMDLCFVSGTLGALAPCPHFTFPQVTVKEK